MGFHAKGTQLQLGDGAATEVFTPIVELRTISIGGMTTPQADATHLDSSWQEFLAGIPDGGSVSFSGNFVPGDATQDEATGLLSTLGNLNNYRLVASDSGAWTVDFSAILTVDSIDFSHDDAARISGTLKVNGEPTFS